jgi:hypothetical protein
LSQRDHETHLRITEGLATDAANDDVAKDDWVLSFDLSELGRVVPECVRWAAWAAS